MIIVINDISIYVPDVLLPFSGSSEFQYVFWLEQTVPTAPYYYHFYYKESLKSCRLSTIFL